MNLNDLRKQYPQYDDMSDGELAKNFHSKFYSDMPFSDFAEKVGYSAVVPQISEEIKQKVAANKAAYERKYKDVSPLKTGLKAMNAEDWADVAGQSLQGAERVADGATLGAYEWANRKLGGNYQERKDRLQQQADVGDIGGLNKVTGLGLEIGGNIAGAGGALAKGLAKSGLKGSKLAMASGGIEGAAYGATGSDTLEEVPVNSALGAGLGVATAGTLYGASKPLVKGAEYTANSINRWHGKRKLAQQLRRGNGFSDVNFGKIDKNKLDELNKIREIMDVDAVNDRLTTVPADRVEHLYQERILKDGYKPKEVVNVLDSALYSKGNKVVKGKFPTLQAFVDDKPKTMNVAIVGKHRDKGNVFVKTSYKKGAGSSLEGRSVPSSDPNYENSSGSLLSARQTAANKAPYADNINLSGKNVKYNNSRSFLEALADKDKSRKIKNAVQSGADDLSEQARYYSEQLAKRKEGMFEPEFENLIKTPELSKAEKLYSNFFKLNGNQTLAPNKVADFYKSNPVAKNILSEMKQIDPRAFDNIAEGSLAEFDMLKKILREEAGNKIRVGASKASALKRAENYLKTLMDNEFKGFREVNRQFADAKAVQDLFESKLKSGLNSVGNATVSPFWSGLSSPVASAGAVGGFVNPTAWGVTAAGLSGKALLRLLRRKTGRDLAKGLIDEGLSPETIKYISAPGAISTKEFRKN